MPKKESYNKKLLSIAKTFVDEAAEGYVKESRELLQKRQRKIQSIRDSLDKSSIK